MKGPFRAVLDHNMGTYRYSYVFRLMKLSGQRGVSSHRPAVGSMRPTDETVENP